MSARRKAHAPWGAAIDVADAAPTARRYRDPRFDAIAIKVFPGDHYVTDQPDEMLVTILGSCVTACIRDPIAAVGGMNHFMLPEDTTGGDSVWLDAKVGLATRYGSFAMESLLNGLIRLGARRERLEVKLFGGGRILQAMTDVGARNIAFATTWLAAEGLAVVAADVGDTLPRRVIYIPATGRVLLKHLRSPDRAAIAAREQQYSTSMTSHAAGNDAELF